MNTDIVNPPEPPAPVPAAPPHKSPFQRLAGVLFAPADTFEDIARRPDFLVPLLFIVLLSYVTTFILVPRMDWDAVTAQQADAMRAKNPNIGEADIARIAKFTKAIGTVTAYVMPVLQIVWFVVVAGVLLLAVRLFGGQGTFGQAFSVTLYSWIPLVLNSVVLAIVAFARAKIDPTTMATLVKSNPAFLVDLKEQPVLFSLLSSFDIFTIWTLILLIIGFAVLSKSSRAKTAMVVIGMWIMLVLIKLGFAAMGAARMKA